MKKLILFLIIASTALSCSNDDKNGSDVILEFKDYGEYFYSMANATWPHGDNHKYLSIPAQVQEESYGTDYYEDTLWIEWWPEGYIDNVPTIVVIFGGSEIAIINGLSGPLNNITFNAIEYKSDDNILQGYFKSTKDFYFEEKTDDGKVLGRVKPM